MTHTGLLALALGLAPTIASAADIADLPAKAPKLSVKARPEKLGEMLDDKGIKVGFGLIGSGFASTYGTIPNKSQLFYGIAISADLDLHKLVGVPDAAIHINQTFSGMVNNDFGSQLGDLYGAIPPFEPQRSRLTKLTYEQFFFDKALQVELGLSNPIDSIARPPCGNPFDCYNPLVNTDTQLYAFVFAYPGISAKYNFNNNYYAKAGVWWRNSEMPFQTGWDFGNMTIPGQVFHGLIGHETRLDQVAYPGRQELLFSFTKVTQTNPAEGIGGGSLVFNPLLPPQTSPNTSSMTFSFMQTVYRADGGANIGDLNPRRLEVNGGIGTSFNQHATGSVGAFALLELNAYNFIPTRPRDNFGVQISWYQVTKDYQHFMQDIGTVVGAPYTQPRDSVVFQVHGNFAVTDTVVLSPSIAYVINPSKAGIFYVPGAPYPTAQPKDGFLFKLGAFVALDKLVGFR